MDRASGLGGDSVLQRHPLGEPDFCPAGSNPLSVCL